MELGFTWPGSKSTVVSHHDQPPAVEEEGVMNNAKKRTAHAARPQEHSVVIGLSRLFGKGPTLEGGCSGTRLCHFLARKFAFREDVTAAFMEHVPVLLSQ